MMSAGMSIHSRAADACKQNVTEATPGAPSIVAELRRIEAEIMAHEAAALELRARSRELLELGSSRRPPARAVSREQRQRLLRQAAGRH